MLETIPNEVRVLRLDAERSPGELVDLTKAATVSTTDQQELSFNGKQLENGVTLQGYKHLVLQLRHSATRSSYIVHYNPCPLEYARAFDTRGLQASEMILPSQI